MPLIKSKAKKAFSKNVETEMDSGKPQKQSLAIAYSVKKQASKKKMASGGPVTVPKEKEATADNAYDSQSQSMVKDRKANGKPAGWTENTWSSQAQDSPSPKDSHPTDMGSDPAAKRQMKYRDKEGRLSSTIPPTSPKAQPSSDYDSKSKSTLSGQPHDNTQHNNGKPAYAEGGEVGDSDDTDHFVEWLRHSNKALKSYPSSPVQKQHQERAASHLAEAKKDPAEFDRRMAAMTGGKKKSAKSGHFAEGGEVGSPDESEPHTGESEQDMLRRHATELAAAGYMAPRPSESEYMADHFAEGGIAEDYDEADHEMEDSGEGEEDEEKDSSVAGAIMAKRRKYADGGMVDLEANSEESPNMEDQYSFDAVKKEQYDDGQISPQPRDSNLKGDSREEDEENTLDHIDIMRRRLKDRRGY